MSVERPRKVCTLESGNRGGGAGGRLALRLSDRNLIRVRITVKVFQVVDRSSLPRLPDFHFGYRN